MLDADELARLQLERRKRAALLVARLKMERGVPQTVLPANPQPPPPPSSVPAAVAHAVVNQLKAQRERAILEEKDRVSVPIHLCTLNQLVSDKVNPPVSSCVIKINQISTVFS